MHPRTRSRTTSLVAGMVLAAASTGISAIDASTRPPNHGRHVTTEAAAPAIAREGGDAAVSCGIERWDVKTGTDPAATTVDITAVKPSTVADLAAIAAPPHPIRRVEPVEETVFEVSATLTFYVTEDDSDYHLVLTDRGRTMIAEIPSPDCVSAGPFKAAIGAARQRFDRRLRRSTSGRKVSIPVTIQGVGFFDRLHHQTGVAPNGIELHPVVAIALPE